MINVNVKKIIFLMTILAVIPFQVSAQEFTKTNKAVQLNLLSVDKLVGNYNNEIKIIFSDIDGTIVKMTEAGAKPVVLLHLTQ